MRQLASAVSHTCISGVYVHPQWNAYDDSLTTVSCATESRTGRLYPVAMGLSQLRASLMRVREDHMGFTQDCIGSSFLRERRKDVQTSTTQYANRDCIEPPPFVLEMVFTFVLTKFARIGPLAS